MPAINSEKQINGLRAFNRLFTRRMGLLNRRLLGSPFSLTEARVLYDLAQRKSTTATEIRSELNLDRGYMSRIVAGFVKQGLVRRERSEVDSREFALSLTATGRMAFRDLDRRSQKQAAALLSGLSDTSRRNLLDGIGRATYALEDRGARDRQLSIRLPKPGDIGWAIELHGRLYAAEFNWDASFEALVATLFAAFATKHDPAAERCWIAEVDGQRVGCVFVVRNGENRRVAQLRCLLVDPIARGLGVGRRLVDECIAFARAAGYEGMMLWTNDVLVSARKIYIAAGFELTNQYKHNSFGHDLVAQVWSMDFGVRKQRVRSPRAGVAESATSRPVKLKPGRK